MRCDHDVRLRKMEQPPNAEGNSAAKRFQSPRRKVDDQPFRLTSANLIEPLGEQRKVFRVLEDMAIE